MLYETQCVKHTCFANDRSNPYVVLPFHLTELLLVVYRLFVYFFLSMFSMFSMLNCDVHVVRMYRAARLIVIYSGAYARVVSPLPPPLKTPVRTRPSIHHHHHPGRIIPPTRATTPAQRRRL